VSQISSGVSGVNPILPYAHTYMERSDIPPRPPRNLSCPARTDLEPEHSLRARSLLRFSCSDRPRTGFDLLIPDLLPLEVAVTILPVLAQPISPAQRSRGQSEQKRRSGA
jgi:hypothetical protein